jgi:AcrR family transcriptional regulator
VSVDKSVKHDSIGSDEIADAALDIIVRNGLAGLTLRPLASGLGISVAAISARMGTKDQLIDRVVDLAASRDHLFVSRWLELADQIAPADGTARSALADLAFRDWLTASRQQVIFLIELIHHRALHKANSPAFDRWVAQSGAFWSTLLFGSPALADLAFGYIIDEAGFSLSAGDDAAYALLRMLCLQRFANGIFPQGAGSCAEIERLIAALAPRVPPITLADDPKRQRIAESAARIIVSQGMDAVTHRSVAEAAGVPASTVVYHFGGRAALMIVGLHAVIARFHDDRDRARAEGRREDDAETRDLVKATSMIALASAREPSMLPYALDMRRRRGENIRAHHMAGLGLHIVSGFDRAAAQLVSIALFGMRMVAMSGNVPERTYYHRAFAALDAWNATRTKPPS